MDRLCDVAYEEVLSEITDNWTYFAKWFDEMPGTRFVEEVISDEKIKRYFVYTKDNIYVLNYDSIAGWDMIVILR